MSNLLIACVYLAGAVITFGGVAGEFWHEFKILQLRPHRWREIAGPAVLFAILCPVGLPVTFLLSGFYKHGLLFRQPPVSPERRQQP